MSGPARAKPCRTSPKQKVDVMNKIRTEYRGEMLFESTVDGQPLTVDVPAAMGGSGRGPTPLELFIASLGSCVAALVANYCHNIEIDTGGLSVDVSYSKADDPTRLAAVRVDVNLPYGDLRGREQSLLRVAEHCPVGKTICTLEHIEFALHGSGDAR